MSKPSTTDDLDDEQRKVELEKQRLEKEEALLIEKKALEEKRQKIEEERVALEAKKRMTLARETTADFGMTVQDITPEVAKYLGLASKSGVIVVNVKDGSPADEVRILPQDIILQVNKVKISSLKDYLREISF